MDSWARTGGVSALAKEILAANENAIVISDGAKGIENVLNFQAAKGRNGLEDKSVYVIVTNLAPPKYAELNVLGQWLGLTDVIDLHYQDQINQAVGRNRGFRDTGGKTETVLFSSPRLWERVLKKFQSGALRTLLNQQYQPSTLRAKRPNSPEEAS